VQIQRSQDLYDNTDASRDVSVTMKNKLVRTDSFNGHSSYLLPSCEMPNTEFHASVSINAFPSPGTRQVTSCGPAECIQKTAELDRR
jgi:hypothetical protein